MKNVLYGLNLFLFSLKIMTIYLKVQNIKIKEETLSHSPEIKHYQHCLL